MSMGNRMRNIQNDPARLGANTNSIPVPGARESRVGEPLPLLI